MLSATPYFIIVIQSVAMLSVLKLNAVAPTNVCNFALSNNLSYHRSVSILCPKHLY
jgi:hypothetical protein